MCHSFIRERGYNVATPESAGQGTLVPGPRSLADRTPRPERCRAVMEPRLDEHTTHASQPVRVLIADDSERVRAAVRSLLDAVGGVEVVGVAADGAEAGALAGDLRPEVVLMDIAMPVLDGIEATRRITSANPSVRVVILTALRDREREAYDAGAVAHVLKEATPDELVRRLRGLVGSRAGA